MHQLTSNQNNVCFYTQLDKIGRIEVLLQMELLNIIHELCPECNDLTTAYLRKGVFLCHQNPTQTTYRSAIVNPFSNTNSSSLVGIIQNWVSTRPYFTLDGLLVWANPKCPTLLSSLGDSECEYEDNSGSGLHLRVTQVLNKCAVKELGQEICNTS